jgi:hypothetical protein
MSLLVYYCNLIFFIYLVFGFLFDFKKIHILDILLQELSIQKNLLFNEENTGYETNPLRFHESIQ